MASQGHGVESYHLTVWGFIFLTLKITLTHNPHQKHEEYGESRTRVRIIPPDIFLFVALKITLTHNSHQKHEEYGECERVVLVVLILKCESRTRVRIIPPGSLEVYFSNSKDHTHPQSTSEARRIWRMRTGCTGRVNIEV